MVKVLLTGMSGVGKSTVLNFLHKDGHITIDLDEGDWIIFDESVDDYLMDTNKIIAFIQNNQKKHLFLAGTTINQREIYPYVDYVISLTAPLSVMRDRINMRTNNPFGKSETEWSRILEDTKLFETQIIGGSDFTVSTDQAIEKTVREIYEFTLL